ncbi:hypothetical protein [Alkanindiges illinoisensis]|uniref:Uncharacterized protein n=1 Tax=Alkanindiges illinoisensis TaxID=197183 RepID=A0A4Y7X8W6_9GAMM|nr:hypothetical protein [Alkanindiges illinoisensis]TEU23351.1 hypothetical protein E2B99_13620 [Alkanindiges illinoisensis]
MKTYYMTWDIIDITDKVLAGEIANSFEFFKDNFGGNCLELFYDRNGKKKPAKRRGWSATITVVAVGEGGIKHELVLDYTPDRKMFLKEFMDGITGYWLAECDATLPDTDCESATAYASCKAPDASPKTKIKKHKQPMRKVKRQSEDTAFNAVADASANQPRIRVSLEDL